MIQPHDVDFPDEPAAEPPYPSAHWAERMDVVRADGGAWTIVDDGRPLLSCATERDAGLVRDLLAAALAMDQDPLLFAGHLGALKDAVAAIRGGM